MSFKEKYSKIVKKLKYLKINNILSILNIHDSRLFSNVPKIKFLSIFLQLFHILKLLENKKLISMYLY